MRFWETFLDSFSHEVSENHIGQIEKWSTEKSKAVFLGEHFFWDLTSPRYFAFLFVKTLSN